MTANNEYQLIKAIASGDSKSFESLLNLHQSAVYGLCFRLMGNAASAQDMAQETWMKVIRAAGQFDPRGSVRAWILTIAKNMCLNELRKHKWEESNPEQIESYKSDEDLEESLIQMQSLGLLKQAVDQLPERQRVALVLFMFEEKSMSELAVEMGLQVNAVKALLHRARENVQTYLRGRP